MRYWLTVHWPPRLDEQDGPLGVWLQDGKVQVADGMDVGDLVFIYQTADGPTAIETHPDGTTSRAPRGKGRSGVHRLARIVAKPVEHEECRREKYTDGKERWWRYLAVAEPINSSGYVPRPEVARMIGYSENYAFLGFGGGSGLKQLSEGEFHQLRERFLGSTEVPDTKTREVVTKRTRFGPGGEGPAHLALKQAIARDPSRLLGEPGLTLWELEYLLPTADKVDIVLKDQFGRFVAVEIEVDCDAEELVGPLQCMKYRALVSYLHDRKPGEVRTILVAHTIDRAVAATCKRFDIQCCTVPRGACVGPSGPGEPERGG